MKRILFVFFAIIASNLSFAQMPSFVLTPYGFRDSADTSKSYVVLNAKERSAKQLYDASLQYINETYKNPDLVIKAKTDSEYVRVDIYAANIATVKLAGAFGVPTTYSINSRHSIEMHFKEGRVKIEIITVDLKTNTDFSFNLVKKKGIAADNLFIYTRDLELKREDTKRQIEGYFNGEISKYYSYLYDKKNDW